MNQFSSISQLIERALDRATAQALPTNIVDKNDGFELSVKVPGVSRKDIVVDIQGRVLKIAITKAAAPNTEQAPSSEAQTAPEQVQAKRVVHLGEFAIPVQAERAFEFREALDAEGASLDLTDGILTISVAYQTRGTKRTLTLAE